MPFSARMPRGRFAYWEKHFAPAPMLRDAWRPVHYVNCADSGPRPGFVRKPVYTIMIDLRHSEAEILRGFRANTRNEIARAEREGTSFAVTADYRRFLALYEAASRHKTLPPVSADYLDSLGGRLRVTEAIAGGETVVTHAYAMDELIGRVRLFYSASSFREFDRSLQSVAGRANRFLHFRDMLHFRAAGFRWYDLGGYEPAGEAVSPDARQVSVFKESFGGKVVQEASYLSLAQHLYRQGRQLLLRARAKRAPSAGGPGASARHSV